MEKSETKVISTKEKSSTEILVIVGPTSTGKSSLALNYCHFLGEDKSAIISADSRQVIKYMDIGTGKIPINTSSVFSKGTAKWTIDGVSVYGYDLATPTEFFSAYDYALFARNKIKELLENNFVPIIVGGTGLYIDIFTGRQMLDSPKPDLGLKTDLEKLSNEDLLIKLRQLNPTVFAHIDKHNNARLIRAVEKELVSNLRPQDNMNSLPDLDGITFKYLGLKAPNEYLFSKVDSWLDTIWDGGLIIETQKIMQDFPDSRKLDGLIYSSAKSFITGQESADVAKQKAKFALHAYIRRQLTWFKRNDAIHWMDISKVSFEEMLLLLGKNPYNSFNG